MEDIVGFLGWKVIKYDIENIVVVGTIVNRKIQSKNVSFILYHELHKFLGVDVAPDVYWFKDSSNRTHD